MDDIGYVSPSRSTDVFDLIADIVIARQEPWRDLAKCKPNPEADSKESVEFFFPIERDGGIEAKKVCIGCPVTKQCKADWMKQPAASKHYGVWFHTTAAERERNRKESLDTLDDID